MSLPERSKVDKRFAEANGRERKTNELCGMWERHHAIARLIALGRSNVEIAKILDITPQTVSNTRNDPIVKVKIKQLQEDMDADSISIGQQIRDLAPKALEILEEMLENEGTNAATRTRIAHDLLDRGGYAAPKQVNVAHAHLTGDQIADMKKRARDCGILATSDPDVIDVN